MVPTKFNEKDNSDWELDLSEPDPSEHKRKIKRLKNRKGFFQMFISTDGACSPNPGRGGWAFVIHCRHNVKKVVYGADIHATNNRMELTAFLKAIMYAVKYEPTVTDLNISTDSEYVYKGFCKLERGELLRTHVDLWREVKRMVVSKHHIIVDGEPVVKVHLTRKPLKNTLADRFAKKACNLPIPDGKAKQEIIRPK